MLLLCFSYFSNEAEAEVNQYGVDCSVTPWMSSCGNEWTQQEGMTEYNISDDGRVQIDLPFTYNYFGNNYTTSWLHSNGVVQFMSPTSSMCCNGIDVANGDWSNYTGLPYFSYSIAALWTDLRDYNVDVDGDGVDDTGFFTHEVDTNNDGQIDTLRYLWRNISEYGRSNNVNTFGTQIDSSGGLEIHHFDINITSHAVTVGVFGDPRNDEVQQFEYYGYGSVYDNNEYTTYYFDLEGACTANPLISTLCDGYAEAYAQLLYDQSCAADPLYDTGCPGYAAAYYTQQCSIDPLYDSGCTGYAEAYYDQQCSLDALYDTECPGYETAYYETYVQPGLEQQANEAAGLDTTTTNTTSPQAAADPVRSLTEVSTTGDATVDRVLRDTRTDTPTQVIEVAANDREEQTNEPEMESSSDVDEPVDSGRDESNSGEESRENREAEPDSEGGAEPGESSSSDKDEDSDKKESKRDKMKKAIEKKATQLAERMSEAATLEMQQAVQAQVLSLINYIPDFANYGGSIQGGYYPDAQIYSSEQLPESRRGLRNGLAQQLLHERMVEQQYER